MQKKKVVFIVGSICIGIIIVLFLLQSIFATVRTKDVEDVPRTVFSDINELDSIPSFTLISKQVDSNDGDYEVAERREYLCNINNKEIKIEAYVFVNAEDAKRKFCTFSNKKADDVTLPIIRDSDFSWITNNFYNSKYCVFKDNCLLYAETNQGQKAISELIMILGDNLSVVVDSQ